MTSESIPEAYPWTAETMVKYMGGTEHKAGPINRPSLLKSPFFPPVLVATLVGLAYVAYKVYQTDFVRMPWLWMTGTLVIFWWSVSGGEFIHMINLHRFPAHLGKEGTHKMGAQQTTVCTQPQEGGTMIPCTLLAHLTTAVLCHAKGACSQSAHRYCHETCKAPFTCRYVRLHAWHAAVHP